MDVSQETQQLLEAPVQEESWREVWSEQSLFCSSSGELESDYGNSGESPETQYKMGVGENVLLYHDSGTPGAGALATTQGALIFNPWNYVTKGTNNDQRNGGEIYPRGMSMLMILLVCSGSAGSVCPDYCRCRS